MAWTDGVDLATGTLVTGTIWNNYNGAAGSLMVVKSHAHGGATGEGSQSIGPLVLEDFTDAAAPAAPGAGKTRIYSTSGRPRYRAGAAGADTGFATAADFAAKGDLLVGTGAAAFTNLAVGANTLVLVADSTQASGVKWGSFALTTAQALLSGDVAMTNANTYYDSVSVSLAAGTWLIISYTTVVPSTGVSNAPGPVTMKLWDGTTVLASCEVANYIGASGTAPPVTGTLATIRVLGSTTTIKTSCAAVNAGSTIKAAAVDNGAGNNASGIVAVKLA